jgi:hypothetical protein
MSQSNQLEKSKNVPYYSWMSLAITLCPLIPIPFVDFFLEPLLAKRMFSRPLSKKKLISLFATKNDSFCLGCIGSLFSGIFFFILKPLRIIRLFFRFNTYIKTFQYWLYKSYITEKLIDVFEEHILEDRDFMMEFALALDLELRKGELGTTMRDNLQEMVVDNGLILTLRSWWKALRNMNQDVQKTAESPSEQDYSLSPIDFIYSSIQRDEDKILKFLTFWKSKHSQV